MLNLFDYVSNNNLIKKYKVDDLLFVEYKCMFHESRIPYWTHSNYFAYVLGGAKKWIGADKAYSVKAGDALFVRKGTYVSYGASSEDFCALLIFVPDEFIQGVLAKYPSPALSGPKASPDESDPIFPLQVDDCLSAYFHSVLSYFPQPVSPPRELLRIKFEELLLHILSGRDNQSVAAFLRGNQDTGKVSIRRVMESSFMHPMSLEEYARLCARSLSTFKADFYEIFKTTPGKWLIHARLRYGKFLIETTDDSVNDVAFKSGFKNTAHFVKVFKETYGTPPLQYRFAKVSAVSRPLTHAASTVPGAAPL